MVRIFSLADDGEWDSLVKSFKDFDVYYLSGYVKAFKINGDGEPFMFYYEDNEIRAIYVYMRRETTIIGIYDSTTPYGYGGFLIEGILTKDNRKALWKEYLDEMKKQNIVSNFVRYHPILENAKIMESFTPVINLGKTVVMDLTSPDLIWTNIHCKNRNMIRKAEKSGIIIKHGKGIELMNKFIEIYNATMKRDNADKYYYFEKPFYESICFDLENNYEIFYAEYEERIVAMSIMIFANKRLNYHLSGSDYEYRTLAPSNLLLYSAAIWGYENGMKTFHLGGGIGSGEDNLYKFKISFNRFSNCQFSIAKHIFDDDIYNKLVDNRILADNNFNTNSHFFPLYRS